MPKLIIDFPDPAEYAAYIDATGVKHGYRDTLDTGKKNPEAKEAFVQRKVQEGAQNETQDYLRKEAEKKVVKDIGKPTVTVTRG